MLSVTFSPFGPLPRQPGSHGTKVELGPWRCYGKTTAAWRGWLPLLTRQVRVNVVAPLGWPSRFRFPSFLFHPFPLSLVHSQIRGTTTSTIDLAASPWASKRHSHPFSSFLHPGDSRLTFPSPHRHHFSPNRAPPSSRWTSCRKNWSTRLLESFSRGLQERWIKSTTAILAPMALQICIPNINLAAAHGTRAIASQP